MKLIKTYCFIFLIIQICQAQIYFRDNTFDQFAYPDALYDEAYTEFLIARSLKQFPRAQNRRIRSYLTTDSPSQVVSYYSKLCGQRFFKYGDHFTYVFTEINDTPATRIEIYPVKIAKLHQSCWPTRIELHIVRYPIEVQLNSDLNQTIDDLKSKIDHLFYQGELQEDVAILDMEELGSDALVYVISTKDDFDKVYSFFRRRLGRFYVRNAHDGDMLTRDFEVDATRYVRNDAENMDISIVVEENPIVVDRNGTPHTYEGNVFIKYIFWTVNSDSVFVE